LLGGEGERADDERGEGEDERGDGFHGAILWVEGKANDRRRIRHGAARGCQSVGGD
jgi:hypothetical protein